MTDSGRQMGDRTREQQLERDIELSETLRRQLERDVLIKAERIRDLENSVQVLEERRADNQQRLFHYEIALLDSAERESKLRTEAATREGQLLTENSRLVELRRAAEQARDSMHAIHAHLSTDLRKQREIAIAVSAERDRLLRGDFTVEEIHGFCHKLALTVSREEFARGCAEYQARLYGPKDNPNGDDGSGSRGADGNEREQRRVEREL